MVPKRCLPIARRCLNMTNTLLSISEEACNPNEDQEPSFGVVCGEDIDAVLLGDEAAARAWAIDVLSTALERVAKFGTEAPELLYIGIEMLWQFSGGEEEGSGELAVRRWLDDEHPRGRQWTKFAELVPSFVESMSAMLVRKVAKQKLVPISDDDLPF